MSLFRKWASTSVFGCPLLVVVGFILQVPKTSGADYPIEVAEFARSAKLSLASAVTAAQAESKEGIPFRAAISRRRPTHAFEVQLLTGEGKVIRIEVDAICGERLASEEEPRTPVEIRELRRLIRRSGVGLADAIDAAVRRTKGVAVRGELRAVDEKVAAAIGLLLHDAESEIVIDRVIKDGDRHHELLVLKNTQPFHRR